MQESTYIYIYTNTYIHIYLERDRLFFFVSIYTLCMSMWIVASIQGTLEGYQKRSLSFLLRLFQSNIESLDSETLFQLRVGATAGFAPTTVTTESFVLPRGKLTFSRMICRFHLNFQACFQGLPVFMRQSKAEVERRKDWQGSDPTETGGSMKGQEWCMSTEFDVLLESTAVETFTRDPWKNTTNFSKNIKNFWSFQLLISWVFSIFSRRSLLIDGLETIFCPPKKTKPF